MRPITLVEFFVIGVLVACLALHFAVQAEEPPPATPKDWALQQAIAAQTIPDTPAVLSGAMERRAVSPDVHLRGRVAADARRGNRGAFQVILKLEYPPSINHYWRHTNDGKHYIAKEGREYREAVYYAAMKAGIRKPTLERLKVSITLTMPDRRKRDLDNTLKALLDALQHARVYHDDEQIDELVISRGPVKKPGGVAVTIESRSITYRQAMGDEIDDRHR